MHRLRDRADADAALALQVRDRDQQAVLRSADAHAAAEMGAHDLHPARDREEIVDQRAKATVRAVLEQRAAETVGGRT